MATAIRIGNPASWYGATRPRRESGGGIDAVTDEEILAAYRFLAAEESVFCEPASAASVAGLLKTGLPRARTGSTVVCVLTGHGLKDPDFAISQISVPTVVEADLGAVLDELSALGRAGRRGDGSGVGIEPPDSCGLLPKRRCPCTYVHRRLHSARSGCAGEAFWIGFSWRSSPHAASGEAAARADLETGGFIPLIPGGWRQCHRPNEDIEARKPMTAEQQLERSVLEGKEREELRAIAQACL